jgi:hypothetical protein
LLQHDMTSHNLIDLFIHMKMAVYIICTLGVFNLAQF